MHQDMAQDQAIVSSGLKQEVASTQAGVDCARITLSHGIVVDHQIQACQKQQARLAPVIRGLHRSEHDHLDWLA